MVNVDSGSIGTHFWCAELYASTQYTGYGVWNAFIFFGPVPALFSTGWREPMNRSRRDSFLLRAGAGLFAGLLLYGSIVIVLAGWLGFDGVDGCAADANGSSCSEQTSRVSIPIPRSKAQNSCPPTSHEPCNVRAAVRKSSLSMGLSSSSKSENGRTSAPGSAHFAFDMPCAVAVNLFDHMILRSFRASTKRLDAEYWVRSGFGTRLLNVLGSTNLRRADCTLASLHHAFLRWTW